jgi:hypothetical protein
MRYLRYADDWLIGFIGPRSEAEAIKRRLKEFLREQLKLTLSETKTLLTHARSERARFLGYEIAVAQADHKHDRRGHRSINGQIGRKTCPSGSFKPNVVPISNEASRST